MLENIPPLDLAGQYKTIAAELEAAVLEVMVSGRYIGGPAVQGFEEQLAAYIGTSECVACASGTDALYLALRALEIGPGNEVITTAFTFMASAEAINLVGATPVFVDIQENTFNMDVSQVEAAITAKTRAILPVHLFGQPVDMTRLMEVAQRWGLAVIEDVAQATGAEWTDLKADKPFADKPFAEPGASYKTGSIGDIGCFSFFPTKNLGCFGDGGACTTNDPAIAAKMRMLKEHGASRRYYHEEIGINSRLDAIQAAILQIKLRYLDIWNDRRRSIARRYHQLLAPLYGVIAPQEIPGGRCVWNQYTIRLKSLDLPPNSAPERGVGRDRIRNQLSDRGISSTVYYPFPLHLMPVYQYLGYRAGRLPVAEQVCQEVLSLPMFPELLPEQQEKIVYTLKDCLLDG